MDAATAVRGLAERAKGAGGRALLVGGAVRDRLLGLTPTDFDVEVYDLPPEAVRSLADSLGSARDVGKGFGVLEIHLGEETLHCSIPRRESKVAPGHRGFAVDTDPTMSPEDAARRRDFTINAIAEDPLTREVLDPFDGRGDLSRRVLRVVDPAHFGEDPLRVLRAAVFVAQFDLVADSASDAIIRGTVPSLRQLPKERISEEWRKLLLRPARPSLGVRLLMDWGVLALLHPDFVRLPETPQEPKWHPEGNVWIHTLMTVDEAAHIVRSQNPEFTTNNAWCLMLAALCHDLGKGTTTKLVNGVWRSIGHDAAGVEPTRALLAAVAADSRTREVVVRLVREHLQPLAFFNMAARGQPATDGTIRKLARRLHPATVALLTFVADADHQGRGPFPSGHAPAAAAGERLRERAAKLGVLRSPPPPVLRGADLVAAGCAPGPEFGAILRRAQELHDEHNVSRAELLRRLQGVGSLDEALARLRDGSVFSNPRSSLKMRASSRRAR